VDYLSEQIILETLQSTFPDHQIHSEEAGDNGLTSDWLWLIDPLDGTNNFAIGLPVFSISMTLLYKREPVLGIVYEPMIDRLFVSSKGQGTYCNDKKIEVKKNKDFTKSNVGWIQGHQVQQHPRAVQLRQYIDHSFKRMMRLWAPTIAWSMLAKGDLDGIILFNSEGDDLYSGILMVLEAGGTVIDYEGNPFKGMIDEPYLIACHPDYKDQFLAVVKEGLK
jgi:myo-inositol-1(or 4)-monophosphatase